MLRSNGISVYCNWYNWYFESKEMCAGAARETRQMYAANIKNTSASTSNFFTFSFFLFSCKFRSGTGVN